MITVCDRENPGSWKERMFYKLGTPILYYLGSKVNKNAFLKGNIFYSKLINNPIFYFARFFGTRTKSNLVAHAG
jgi:hypothetical protein